MLNMISYAQVCQGYNVISYTVARSSRQTGQHISNNPTPSQSQSHSSHPFPTPLQEAERTKREIKLTLPPIPQNQLLQRSHRQIPRIIILHRHIPFLQVPTVDFIRMSLPRSQEERYQHCRLVFWCWGCDGDGFVCGGGTDRF